MHPQQRTLFVLCTGKLQVFVVAEKIFYIRGMRSAVVFDAARQCQPTAFNVSRFFRDVTIYHEAADN